MLESGWMIFLPYVLGLVDICISFEIGGDDFSWPGSTWDQLGLTVGYGHPGWDQSLPELPVPFETNVVHNHYHHIVGGGGPGMGGPAPNELIYGPLYQRYPSSGHNDHHKGHYHPSREWYCHHAKKAKHFKKWFAKMLFCSLTH